MKRIAMTVALVTGLVLGGAGFSAAEAAHKHVSRKVCAEAYLHPHSKVAKQCRKQGWWIEVSQVPLDEGHYMTAYLVIGPRGRVYMDTLGETTNIR